MRSARNVNGMRSRKHAAPRERPSVGSYRRKRRKAKRNAAAVVVSGNSMIHVYMSFLERRGWVWHSHNSTSFCFVRNGHHLYLYTDGHYRLKLSKGEPLIIWP